MIHPCSGTPLSKAKISCIDGKPLRLKPFFECGRVSRKHAQQENCGCSLTFVAAQLHCAPGVVAQDGVRAGNRGVVVWARMVRTLSLEALGLLALAVVAVDLVSVVDRRVPVGATDRVAESMLFLSSRKRD